MPEEVSRWGNATDRGFKLCPIRKGADVWRVSNHKERLGESMECTKFNDAICEDNADIQKAEMGKRLNLKQAELYVNRLWQ